MLGSPILYLKGMRAIMFQLSGFYSRPLEGAFLETDGALQAILGPWGSLQGSPQKSPKALKPRNPEP